MNDITRDQFLDLVRSNIPDFDENVNITSFDKWLDKTEKELNSLLSDYQADINVVLKTPDKAVITVDAELVQDTADELGVFVTQQTCRSILAVLENDGDFSTERIEQEVKSVRGVCKGLFPVAKKYDIDLYPYVMLGGREIKTEENLFYQVFYKLDDLYAEDVVTEVQVDAAMLKAALLLIKGSYTAQSIIGKII